MEKYPFVRAIYLYLFALLGLVLLTIGGVQLLGLGLKVYVFTKADQVYVYPMAKPVPAPPGSAAGKNGPEYSEPSAEDINIYQKNQLASQRQKTAAEAVAMILVGLPLYLYHWSAIKKDRKGVWHENA